MVVVMVMVELCALTPRIVAESVHLSLEIEHRTGNRTLGERRQRTAVAWCQASRTEG